MSTTAEELKDSNNMKEKLSLSVNTVKRVKEMEKQISDFDEAVRKDRREHDQMIQKLDKSLNKKFKAANKETSVLFAMSDLKLNQLEQAIPFPEVWQLTKQMEIVWDRHLKLP